MKKVCKCVFTSARKFSFYCLFMKTSSRITAGIIRDLTPAKVILTSFCNIVTAIDTTRAAARVANAATSQRAVKQQQ